VCVPLGLWPTRELQQCLWPMRKAQVLFGLWPTMKMQRGLRPTRKTQVLLGLWPSCAMLVALFNLRERKWLRAMMMMMTTTISMSQRKAQSFWENAHFFVPESFRFPQGRIYFPRRSANSPYRPACFISSHNMALNLRNAKRV
jgi:hypothetical protein